MPLKHNLMTTLHVLVTIYELFAGFHLINTGVVNCLIMCQNASKMHHSESKKSQKFLPLAPRYTLDLTPKRKFWIRQWFSLRFNNTVHND